jgi:hypothetical protein
VRGGPFSLGRTRALQAASIQSIDAHSNTAVGSQQLYNVQAVDSQGKRVVLAKWLPNQRLAQHLIDRITAAL